MTDDARPVHIEPLDNALTDWLDELDQAEQVIDAFLDEHLDVIEAYQAALKRNDTAREGVDAIDRALRRLGHDPLPEVRERVNAEPRAAAAFEADARARRDLAPAHRSKAGAIRVVGNDYVVYCDCGWVSEPMVKRDDAEVAFRVHLMMGEGR